MRKSTVLYPYSLPGNVVLDIIKKVLDDIDIEVISFREGLLNINSVDVINFNFFDTIHSSSTIACYGKFIAKSILIYLIKLLNIKVIYTIHNKQGHETRYPDLDYKMMKKLMLKSDKIVILCNETKSYLKDKFGEALYKKIEAKIVWIPHPSYEGFYPESGRSPRNDWRNKEGEMVALFMGAVRPYKNIELIIDAAERLNAYQIKFVIAGGGKQEYIAEINKIIKEKDLKNVVFEPRFIENSEVVSYVRSCDIMVLPYNLKSSLNSGSCILAFSYHRNVICPRIGTIKDLPEELCYTYEYDSTQEHIEKLCDAIITAYTDFHNNHQTFLKRQEMLYNIMHEDYSIKRISEIYKKMYLELR